MLKSILEQDFPIFGDGLLNKALAKAHENGWLHPETLPSGKSMNIVTVVNLLEQDYCE
ncbi:MAG: hypothetical protein HYT27_00505 [Parcubacteria group bacterium]|nr:hypothetical protein [Parcubacteria group bacterium]